MVEKGTKVVLFPTGGALKSASWVAAYSAATITGVKCVIIPTGSRIKGASWIVHTQTSNLTAGTRVICMPTGSALSGASWIAITSCTWTTYVPPVATNRIKDPCMTNVNGDWLHSHTYEPPYGEVNFNQSGGPSSGATCLTHASIYSRLASNNVITLKQYINAPSLTSVSFYWKMTSDFHQLIGHLQIDDSSGNIYASTYMTTTPSNWVKHSYTGLTGSPTMFRITMTTQNDPGVHKAATFFITEVKVMATDS